MRIDVLGMLRVRGDDGAEHRLSGEKARGMLRLLVAAGGQPVPIQTISDVLWDGRPPRSCLPNIQTYASRIRALLARAGCPGDQRLDYASGAYRLRLLPHESDLLCFADLARRGRAAVTHDPSLAARVLHEAAALWQGPPLPADLLTATSPACGIARRWEELRLSVYTGLVDAACAGADPSGLVGELQQLAAQHPHRESVQQLLLRVLYLSGDVALALATYHQFRCALRDEMGVEPAARLRRIYEAILREEPLDAAAPHRAMANV
ncbi:AfsR/SARP family transcriptional regulator [Micromonospora chersina]|uniref:AfsR/SARP family transcriptional regulator n=1 Tax=Micromonospora chersina TaxID=47854 RepID=UPI0037174E70